MRYFRGEGITPISDALSVAVLYHDQDDNPVLGLDDDDHHNHSPIVHSTPPTESEINPFLGRISSLYGVTS